MLLLFKICVLTVLYTYAGYPVLVYLLIQPVRWFRKKREWSGHLPSVTLLVPAYNERACIENKINNTLSLRYPADKIKYLFVTDGSTDGTDAIVAKYPQCILLHAAGRQGKAAAINRAMPHVDSDIVFFTDANTLLNSDALINSCQHYDNDKTGVVAGEKRVRTANITDATVGEGCYWKYESLLRNWDATLYSVMGTAGELYSIRSHLFQPIPPDTLSDDFTLSMTIVLKGYRIAYEPGAFATEDPSADASEECKRKTRIATGSIQAMFRMKKLMWPFPSPLLSFQYISHRVMRWAVAPYALLMALALNIGLVMQGTNLFLYIFLLCQFAFYGMAVIGWLSELKKWKAGFLFLPFYFCMMQYAAIAGLFRYLFHLQPVAWNKIKRK